MSTKKLKGHAQEVFCIQLNIYNSWRKGKMKETRKKFGERIKILRKAKDLTQEELGEKANLSYKFIGEIERGQTNPSFDTLAALAKALNINISQLFEETSQLPLDYQLPTKDIQLIKEALPALNKILTGWKTKELEGIKKALIPLNKLFLKK